jgi:hypothetical protein
MFGAGVAIAADPTKAKAVNAVVYRPARRRLVNELVFTLPMAIKTPYGICTNNLPARHNYGAQTVFMPSIFIISTSTLFAKPRNATKPHLLSFFVKMWPFDTLVLDQAYRILDIPHTLPGTGRASTMT